MEPKRPTARSGFEIAIICALAVEADAVRALFDRSWDDEYYGKLSSDPNTYFLGSIGPHNVVLAYRSHLKKTSAAIVAACCRISFPGVKLALIAGVCGVVPFRPRTNTEIVLGDVIISTLTVEHHLSQGGYRRSEEKSTYLASPTVIEEDARAFLAKLESLGTRKMLSTRTSNHLDKLQGQPELQATYPGISHDKLFDTSYPHPQLGNERTCEECGCNGRLVARRRFLQDTPQPAAHFGRIACGDVAIKDGRVRDEIAEQYGVIGFEMESVGVWNAFPCILVMGSCDYADGHNPKTWLRYAAATAAAYVKAILESWAPSATELSRQVNDIRALKRELEQSFRQLSTQSK
jgi:nucleoside phosphorylase